MENSNQSLEVTFILVGLSNIPQLQVVLFSLFLTIYMITISANLLIIIVVNANVSLRSPMYFFLTNLSCIDLFVANCFVPKILVNTLSKDKSISLVGCAAQVYFSTALGTTECLILGVMAFDRYTAICDPLRYNTIMDRKLCICLAAGCWTMSFLNSIVHVVLTFRLPFCHRRNINHFFCEIPPLLHLSCSNTRLNEIVTYAATVLLVLSTFLFTVISYVNIISSVLKIKSRSGRLKTFSTCSSHLTVVSLFFGNILFIYMQPPSLYSSERDKVVSILYTVVIPMLNPIIYSIRNKDVTQTIKQVLVRKKNMLK
ncbi:olfactory receptor 5V1-like [Pelodytes ibericus]